MTRTLHGVEIESMLPHEREFWLRRYTEYLADAVRRRDRLAEDLYLDECLRLRRADPPALRLGQQVAVQSHLPSDLQNRAEAIK